MSAGADLGTLGAPSPAERRWPELLHGALLAAAFCIFARHLAAPSGMVAGAVAAVLGAATAGRLVRLRYRLPVVIGAAFAGALSVALAAELVDGSPLLAGALGPAAALELVDALRWAALAACLATVLRGVGLRYRAALAVEGAVVVVAVAATVAAHRDGMIARPLEVSDWFWTQGLDPVVAFLGVGLVGGVLMAAVLAQGRSRGRTLAQLVVVLLLGIFVASRIHSRDPDVRRDVTGGTSDDEEKKARAERGGSGTGGQGEGSGGSGAGKDGRPPAEPPNSPFDGGMPKSNGGGEGRQNRPAAVVVFHKDVVPSMGLFYFRHAAFSQYNGIRLVEATASGMDEDVPTRFPTAATAVPGPADGEGREAVATDVALIESHTRLFGLIDPVELGPKANPSPARFRRAYRVVSQVLTAPYDELFGRRPGDPSWTDEEWAHYTALPRDERYHRLASELQGSLRAEFASDPLAQAMVVKQHLEKTVTYSFRESYEGTEDPTAAFLFSEDPHGYCVHTSHAAALLLRAMGVPTRVGAGYAVPAKNLGGGSSLLIKTSDAHAWAEIHLEGVGWVPIEITPEKTDVEPSEFAERDLQSLLGEMARAEGKDERAAPRPPELMKALRALLDLVPWLIALLISLAYGAKAWRLLAPGLVGPRSRPRVAYRAALDRLSAVGRVRASGESRERFARRLAELSPSLSPLTAVHLGTVFGRGTPEDELAVLPDLAVGVGREVRRRVPRWRWLLGVLNPISWWWSR